ncbi:MAG: Crp/Fnr family transcriptional regulator [Gemmatimonadetes bacterium]|nr:Crp/Fnr family transcriptional regulator [Gemmatimonadota bacterium]
MTESIPRAGSSGVLQNLTPDLIDSLKTHGEPFRLAGGSVVFDIGDHCDGFSLLLEGTIRVVLPTPDGKEILLYRVKPGEGCILTLSSLVSSTHYPAKGIADADLSGYTIPRARFLGLMAENPAFQSSIYRFIGERVAELIGLVEQLAFWQLPQRLAALLLSQGPMVEATHTMLADELGCSREIISRHLKHFEEDGVVSLGRRHIEVIDAGHLRGMIVTS